MDRVGSGRGKTRRAMTNQRASEEWGLSSSNVQHGTMVVVPRRTIVFWRELPGNLVLQRRPLKGGYFREMTKEKREIDFNFIFVLALMFQLMISLKLLMSFSMLKTFVKILRYLILKIFDKFLRNFARPCHHNSVVKSFRPKTSERAPVFSCKLWNL